MTPKPDGSPNPRRCDLCRYALLEDYGYSNYTTEGTEFHCLKRLHPKREGFDRFYGETRDLEFAEECASFDPGKAIEVDVDREASEDPFGFTGGEPWWFAYVEDEERRTLMGAFEKERDAGAGPIGG